MAFLKTPLFSTSAKLRLLKEPFISRSNPDAEESLADFVRRRIGDEFLDYAINPFVAGVYAGDPEELSVKSSFPKLFELEQKHGSLIKGAVVGAKERKKQQTTSKQNARMFSFTDGMQAMIDALATAHAETIHTGIHIESIGRDAGGFVVTVRLNGGSTRFRSRELVLAVPTYAYGELNFLFDFPLRGQLERVFYPPVAGVFFGFKANPARIPLDGFGFLVPKKENRKILGTIWSSTIFSGRAPEGGVALSTFVGGSRQPEMAALDDGRLVDAVKKDLRGLMGIEQSPDTVVVARWEKAIPQYRLGHQTIIDAIERFENECPGIHVTGNFRSGISVADCITGAKGMSERIASSISKKR
jgi:oxygen-dependent protoporphyrinogen oxidase